MYCRNCKKKLTNKVIHIGSQCISSVFPEKIIKNLKEYSFVYLNVSIVSWNLKNSNFQICMGDYKTSLSPLT